MTRATHPPDRVAKKLKRAWVEKEKIKYKWRAEKRKAGLVSSEKRTGKESPSEPRTDPNSLMEQPPAQSSEQAQHPIRDGTSPRELGKTAYSNSRGSRRDDARKGFDRRRGQPDMKSRMNVLLAKIKRDYQN